jgi:hypothetical protein
MSDLPPEFLDFLQTIKGKRSRIVIDHILKHNFITTEDLEEMYGYKHPPRAIRDVREQGVPLETFKVKSSHGRMIAAYRFASTAQVRHGRIGGRKVFPKRLKQELLDVSQGKCFICNTSYASQHLQIDHRVPYEVLGDIYSKRARNAFLKEQF